jgi:hypothetical protein
MIRRAAFAPLLPAALVATFALGRFGTLDARAIHAQDLKRYVAEDTGAGDSAQTTRR